MTEEQRADLRDQLVALRTALVERLVQRIDGGDIALLGSVGAAIATLDAMPTEPAPGGGVSCRAVGYPLLHSI
jgi:hypothetical protein